MTARGFKTRERKGGVGVWEGTEKKEREREGEGEREEGGEGGKER